MKISSQGLAVIEQRIKDICGKLTRYADMKVMNSEQREDFRELQEELRRRQHEYKTFSDPMSGK